MEEELANLGTVDNESKLADVIYNPDKDFYKGISGELRFKAEGLFKKAREKGISIEEVEINSINKSKAEFPGIGVIELPAFIVKIKGRNIQSGQTIVDGKQVDYYNRYQGYIADKIEKKNVVRDEKGKIVREFGSPKIKDNMDLTLTDWEQFEIGKNLLDDKEFGLEKTITGACDRVIRKLMGENDWLYPHEAKLLDEEYNNVQNKMVQDNNKKTTAPIGKKATERQISYFKSKIKNYGLNPDDDAIIKEIIKHSGFEGENFNDLSTGDMSKIIDNIGTVMPQVKNLLTRKNNVPLYSQEEFTEPGTEFRQ